MKLVRVLDLHGFERPLTAVTLLVPTDWTLRGDVRMEAGNVCTALPRVSFRAASPDGRVAVENFPMTAWSWSEHPRHLQLMERTRLSQAQFGLKGCDLAPPLSAKEYLTRVLIPMVRPGARVLAVAVDPEAQEAVQQMARAQEARSSSTGLPTQVRADTARVHVAYDRDGRAEEAWVTGMTIARASPAPFLDLATNQLIQVRTYSCGADFLFAASAPAGRLPAHEKLFRAILGSVRVDPAWMARVQQVRLQVAAGQVRSAAERSRIVARSTEETGRMMDESWRRQQESQDLVGERWAQSMRGVETFRNPSTGETIDLSNRYENVWSNGRGEYLLSDSSAFDPSTVSREGWTRLQRVDPGADR